MGHLLLTGPREVANGHVELVELHANPARLAEGVGALRRNFQRFLDSAFGSGKVVTPPISAREVQEEGRIVGFFSGRLLNQADALLVILPAPCFLGFPVESLDRRVRFILQVWPAHVCKNGARNGKAGTDSGARQKPGKFDAGHRIVRLSYGARANTG